MGLRQKNRKQSTKQARKHTLWHTGTCNKMQENEGCQINESGVVGGHHSGHAWVWMGTGGHYCARHLFGARVCASRSIFDRKAHTRTSKRRKNQVVVAKGQDGHGSEGRGRGYGQKIISCVYKHKQKRQRKNRKQKSKTSKPKHHAQTRNNT